MLVWLPQPALADRLGPLAGVEVDVLLDWDGRNVPSSADAVEVVVPPPMFHGDLAPLFGRLPRLRIVQTLSAGVDRVVTAVPDAVHVINARGLHTPSTAEWVCAAILACQRDLPDFVRAQQAAQWSHHGTRTLDGATVLLIGTGSIGSAVEERLRPFGCRFLRVARSSRQGVRTADALPELLPQADVVVLLVPLTAETEGMVDRGFLSLMAQDALLVNASRGSVVDTEALLAELVSGRLRAALDVTDPEPLPDGHPLWRAPGLLLTPHVAAVVPTMLDRQAAMLRDRLPRWAAGEDPIDMVSNGY